MARNRPIRSSRTVFKKNLLAVAVAHAIAGGASAATIAVNSLDDDGDGGNCTLREALVSANNDAAGGNGCADGSGADVIEFDGSLSLPATITLSGSALPVTSAVTLDGPGADRLTISGDGVSNARVMTIDDGTATAQPVIISGLTLANGSTSFDGMTANTGKGGAVFNTEDLAIHESALSGNEAYTGGAIANYGPLSVTNSLLSGNYAYAEGGAMVNGGIPGSDTATLVNVTISGNSAGSTSGAIRNDAVLNVTNATISDNSSGYGAAALSNFISGTVSLTNTIVANSVGKDCDNFGTVQSNVASIIEDGGCSAPLSGDPALGPLQNNGGATATHALDALSTAVDAGDNGACPSVDQRGFARTDSSCDIGAFELSAVAPQPDIDISGNSLSIVDGDDTPNEADGTDFGELTFGDQSSASTFEISNTGDSLLTLSPVNLAEGLVLTSAPDLEISPGGSTTFGVAVAPQEAGVFVADVVIESNDPDEDPYNFAVTVNAIPPAPEINVLGNGVGIVDGDSTPDLADHTNFGSVRPGSDITRRFTIENTGPGSLTVTSADVASANGAFAVTPPLDTPTTLTSGQSVFFDVRFAPGPEAPGTSNAVVTVVSDDADEGEYTFDITGERLALGDLFVDTLADTTDIDGLCSLREAVVTANTDGTHEDCGAASGHDVIAFDPTLSLPGTITLTDGELLVTSDITIQGPGADQLTLTAGNSNGRVLNLYSTDSVSSINVSVQGVRFRSSGLPRYQNEFPENAGGAILNRGQTLTLSDCHLIYNDATFGGAIAADGGLTVLERTTFEDNEAYGGPAVYAKNAVLEVRDSQIISNLSGYESGGIELSGGTLRITNSQLTDNYGGGRGGAIRATNGGVVEVDLSTFDGNYAENAGGAIYLSGSTLTMNDSTLSNNSAANDGGAIYLTNDSTVSVVRSTLTGNTASARGGGAISAVYTGNIRIISSTLSGNSGNQGGTFFLGYAGKYDVVTAQLFNVTLLNSSASTGAGGIYAEGRTDLSITNSVITGSPNACSWGSEISVTTNRSNFVNDGTCDENAFNNITGDPMLGPLQDNGGPTQTHAILMDSPLIDAGHSESCVLNNLFSRDQTGVARSLDGDGDLNAICDIGAFEYDATTVETNSAPVINDVCPSFCEAADDSSGALVVQATATDADGNVPLGTWEITAGNDRGGYTIGGDGKITVADPLKVPTKTTLSLRVADRLGATGTRDIVVGEAGELVFVASFE